MNNIVSLVAFLVSSILATFIKPRIEMFLTFDNLLSNKFGWQVDSDPTKDIIHVTEGLYEAHYIITPKGVKVSRGDDPKYYPASSTDPIWAYIEYKK